MPLFGNRGQHVSHDTCDFTWRLGKDEWAVGSRNVHIRVNEDKHTCSKANGHSGDHKCKCRRTHGN